MPNHYDIPSSKKRLFILSIILVIALSLLLPPPKLFSQDETPPPVEPPTEMPSPLPPPTEPPTPILTETPTATATATETATETPTVFPTPTPSPSETAMVENTPTETLAATPTETETPFETATATSSALPLSSSDITPTASATAGEALVLQFSDTFDYGEANWLTGDGWRAVPYENNPVLWVSSSFHPARPIGYAAYNVAWETRVRISSGQARLTVRDSATDRYTATIHADGTVELFRSGVLLAAASVLPVPAEQWRTARLSAIGDQVVVTVDGLEALHFTDPTPLPLGEVTLGGDDLTPEGLFFDDVMLWVGVSELQPMFAPPPVSAQVAAAQLPSAAAFNGQDAVVFEQQNVGSLHYKIYSTDADGGNWTVLTPDSLYPYSASSSSLSPDGRWIIFIGSEGSEDVWKIIDTFADPMVIHTLGPASGGKVVWKPDGTSIAFTSGADGNADIWTAQFHPGDASTPPSLSNFTNVTNTSAPAQNHVGTWGQNGLIYVYSLPGFRSINILFKPPDFTFVAPAFSATALLFGAMSWSPDGTRVAYSLPEQLGTYTTTNLFYFTVSDGVVTRVTDDHAQSSQQVIHNAKPDWSHGFPPDNNDWLFFERFIQGLSGGGWRIHRIRIDGQFLSTALSTYLSFNPSASTNVTVGSLQPTPPTPTPTPTPSLAPCYVRARVDLDVYISPNFIFEYRYATIPNGTIQIPVFGRLEEGSNKVKTFYQGRYGWFDAGNERVHPEPGYEAACTTGLPIAPYLAGEEFDPINDCAMFPLGQLEDNNMTYFQNNECWKRAFEVYRDFGFLIGFENDPDLLYPFTTADVNSIYESLEWMASLLGGGNIDTLLQPNEAGQIIHGNIPLGAARIRDYIIGSETEPVEIIKFPNDGIRNGYVECLEMLVKPPIIFIARRATSAMSTLIHELGHVLDCDDRIPNALVTFQSAIGAMCRQNGPRCDREDYNSENPNTREIAFPHFDPDPNHPDWDITNATEDFGHSFESIFTVPRVHMLNLGNGIVPVPNGAWERRPLRYEYMRGLVEQWRLGNGIDPFTCSAWVREYAERRNTPVIDAWITYICQAVQQ